MTSISSLATELDTIEVEMKKLMDIVNCLKKRRVKVEQSIIECLQLTNQPGFTYKGKIYTPIPSQTYRKKKKTEKAETIKSILEHSGVKPDSDVVQNVFEVFKSKRIPIQKLTTRKSWGEKQI